LVVVCASDQSRAAVGRERELEGERPGADLAAARELGPLLEPGGTGAREDPGCTGFRVVDVSADERERAVG